MNTNIINSNQVKKAYVKPELDLIELDNEISLILQSADNPPTSDDWETMIITESSKSDPYKA
jgi:hypothetical protein